MTHAEAVRKAIASVATDLPGFDKLDPQIQGSLLELGEHYFTEEFVPRLEGMINVPRYEEAMNEQNEADRAFIEDQLEFLTETIVKAQRAAHQELAEKYNQMIRKKNAGNDR